MKHIKPVNIYLGKYGISQPNKEDSDEEKICKYAESLYGNRCVNSQQKLELVNHLSGVYDKDVILNALKSACSKQVNESYSKEYGIDINNFKKFYDTTLKRYYWILGYFDGNVVRAYLIGKDYAEMYNVDLKTVKTQEIISSRRYKSCICMYSTDEHDKLNEEDYELPNVWQFLTD